MKNVVVQNVDIRDVDVAWRSIARLRVTIERFEGGDAIASLVANPSFVGHGRSEHEAVADMMDEIAHELRFYRDADESTLTSDAKATKEMLAEQFEPLAEGEVMASWNWRSVRRALLDKGFRLERSTNHEYYRLYVQGKASSVRTKVSHGNMGELNSSSPLMRRYQAQLRLDKARAEDLLECPLTGQEYVRILVANGELEP